jgi:hypothetical protein
MNVQAMALIPAAILLIAACQPNREAGEAGVPRCGLDINVGDLRSSVIDVAHKSGKMSYVVVAEPDGSSRDNTFPSKVAGDDAKSAVVVLCGYKRGLVTSKSARVAVFFDDRDRVVSIEDRSLYRGP